MDNYNWIDGVFIMVKGEYIYVPDLIKWLESERDGVVRMGDLCSDESCSDAVDTITKTFDCVIDAINNGEEIKKERSYE